MQLQLVMASVLSALDSNFGKESSSSELAGENIAHDIRSVDTKFTADPTTWDIAAWKNSGELEGFSEVGTGTGGTRDELTHAALNTIAAKKTDVDTVVSECETGLNRVYRKQRLLNVYLGNTVQPKAQPNWERATTHARIELGDTRNELGDWPSKPIPRCFAKYRQYRRILREILSRAQTTQTDVRSGLCPEKTVWFTSDRDCDFHESNHLVKGLHGRSYEWAADGELVSSNTTSADEPCSEWSQLDYHTDPTGLGQYRGSLSMSNPVVHMHYGYFKTLREGRAEALTTWMGRNVRRAWAIAGHAGKGNTVTTEAGRVYKMSQLEAKEWTKRQRIIADAWTTGKLGGPDWRETSILTFGQCLKLKQAAWQVINQSKASKTPTPVPPPTGYTEGGKAIWNAGNDWQSKRPI